MNIRSIIVTSHPRSGTHFLIDALRLNLPGAVFPQVKKWESDFNYGALFRDDVRVNRFFAQQLEQNECTIIKSHLLPCEIEVMMNSDRLSNIARSLAARIWQHSAKLYIYRDVRDVMISYYHIKDWSVGFSEFLRSENHLDKFGMRSKSGYDNNRLSFWVEHVSRWLEEPDVYAVKYEDLNTKFESLMTKLIGILGEKAGSKLVKPDKDERPKVSAPITRLIQKQDSPDRASQSTNYVGTRKRGGWEQYYRPEDTNWLGETTGQVMRKLGYSM